jgi:adenosylcobinamide kinase/adenosylcobinamide-phosphate guanylyltransferase
MPGRPGDPRLALVLGGARSGKSSYAESLVRSWPPPWLYIATAQALDEEMTERIELHRQRRGEDWTTIEAPLRLADAIADAGGRPLLVDCLTLWLTNHLLAGSDLDAEAARLEASLADRRGLAVLVANEVGLGIVPDNSLARRFRDAAGRLNQRLAAIADDVVLMVAGLPMKVK